MKTGGYLNTLACEIKLSRDAPNTMELIKTHHPAGEEEMAARVNDAGGAENGLKGLSDKLHAALATKAGTFPPGHAVHMLTRRDCIEFVYGLFVKAPLQGAMMEQQALRRLQQAVDDRTCGRFATAEEDYNYRVDLVFPGCGVQVKPISYKRKAEREPWMMRKALECNKGFGLPVYWLYYDGSYDAGFRWVNLDEVVASVKAEYDIVAAAAFESPVVVRDFLMDACRFDAAMLGRLEAAESADAFTDACIRDHIAENYDGDLACFAAKVENEGVGYYVNSYSWIPGVTSVSLEMWLGEHEEEIEALRRADGSYGF